MLLRRLDRALDLAGDVDAPDRQRTLRTTIAWSHDLLAEPERALLARLSVCAGGCTLDTAEAVGAADGDLDVLEALSTLVGHSLVTSTDPGEGEPRFRMLELVRAFAAERLRERGEEEATRERLGAPPGLGQRGRGRWASTARSTALWRARLDAEATDLQAALRWAVDHDRAELAVALAAPAGPLVVGARRGRADGGAGRGDGPAAVGGHARARRRRTARAGPAERPASPSAGPGRQRPC